MAKVLLQNPTERDIHLNLTTDNGAVATVTIPASRMEGTAENARRVPGQAEADDSFIEQAMKGNPANKAFFDEGLLRIVKSEGPAPTKKAA